MKRYTMRVCCWASSIVSTAQGLKVSEDMKASVEDTVRGFLGGVVMRVFNHIPISKSDASCPCSFREGHDEG